MRAGVHQPTVHNGFSFADGSSSSGPCGTVAGALSARAVLGQPASTGEPELVTPGLQRTRCPATCAETDLHEDWLPLVQR